MTTNRPRLKSREELRAEMRAAVKNLWEGVDSISPNFERALRRAAQSSEEGKGAA